ncbi:MAG TPA: thioesterase family protein [Anaerolineales bacterium]
MTDPAFTGLIRVRAYECDAFGHLNNAVYLQYLQQVTLDALGSDSGDGGFWDARGLSIEYRTPAIYGDELQVAAWVIAVTELVLLFGYRIMRLADHAPVAQAEIEWSYRDPTTHALCRLPRNPLATPVFTSTAPLKPFVSPQDNGSKPFHWQHAVRFYELDATKRVGLAVYFQWIQAAFFHATGSVGWTLEKMRDENFVSLQYRHDAEFFGSAKNGDEIEIASRLIEIRRVRGVWLHEIYRAATKELLLRDFSTGAFLDWKGNIRSGPMEILGVLTRGEQLE